MPQFKRALRGIINSIRTEDLHLRTLVIRALDEKQKRLRVYSSSVTRAPRSRLVISSQEGRERSSQISVSSHEPEALSQNTSDDEVVSRLCEPRPFGTRRHAVSAHRPPEYRCDQSTGFSKDLYAHEPSAEDYCVRTRRHMYKMRYTRG